MFLGHFGLALAAKRVARKPSLGTLFAAAQLPDIVWPVLLATGVEQVAIDPAATPVTPLRFVSYPFSHSLLAMTLWGTAFGLAYFLRSRDRRGAFVIFGLVLSHFVLDVIVHVPDMPLWPGNSPSLGLGAWHSRPLTLLLEGTFFLGGLWLYATATAPKDLVGRVGLTGLAVLLGIFYGMAFLGPPPPNLPTLVRMSILGAVLLVVLGAWVDRHRAPL
jgi:hypothetical protein